MKLQRTFGAGGRADGILLLECLVYIALLALVLALAYAAFEACWKNSTTLRATADDVTSVIEAGERWRADIRAATGEITTDSSGSQQLRIPQGTNAVLYRVNAREVQRKIASAPAWRTVARRVNVSRMEIDRRSHISAWCWDLELVPRRPRGSLRPQFTFEAVPIAK